MTGSVPTKTCIWCEHFDFEEGCPEYSEYTPGYESELVCLKGHWKLDNYNDSLAKYREKVSTATTCEDYKLDKCIQA